MSKEIPWVQTYPYLPEPFNYPDDVPGPLPEGISEDELQTLIDAGFEFITHFDGPDPFANPTTLILRQGKKQFMTKLPVVDLKSFADGAIWAEHNEGMRKLLRAALDDMVAFGHDGKSA